MSDPRPDRMHYTSRYLISPTNPVTVHLIGAGGTGCVVLMALAKMNHAMITLGHPGLFVTVWDGDTVSKANFGRQLFASAELGHNKAIVLINRINRFFGTSWKAQPRRYSQPDLDKIGHDGAANLILSCVDTVAARIEIARILRKVASYSEGQRDQPYYWMDFGNSQKTGQVMLATVGKIGQPQTSKHEAIDVLPFITDEYEEELAQAKDDNTPSCSLAEALHKQDLFINPALADMGASLLWNLFRNGMTENRGFFLNLSDFRSQPVRV